MADTRKLDRHLQRVLDAAAWRADEMDEGPKRRKLLESMRYVNRYLLGELAGTPLFLEQEARNGEIPDEQK